MDDFRSALAGMLRRVSVVEVDDTGSQQRIRATGLSGEEFRNVVRLQPHGFSSVPPVGAEGVILTMGGRSDRAHFLGLEHKDRRPTGRKAEEGVLYGPDDQEIYISKDGITISGGKNKKPLTITVGSSKVTVSDGKVTITGAQIVLDGTVFLGGADASLPIGSKVFAK